MNSIKLVFIVCFGISISSLTLADKDIKDPENCIGCHQQAKVEGIHSGSLFGHTNQVADCIDCHGQVSDLEKHKLSPIDVVQFQTDETTIEQQNQACLSCHEAEPLRFAHWTHDVHVNALSCASCHSLHTNHDPVLGLTEKATIKLCVDCHGTQSQLFKGEAP
jgi:cytochrome c-type protein NrfB